MKLAIIYVPGLGDDIYWQGCLVKLWRLYGVHGHIHPMPWAGPGKFAVKFKKLLEEIDDFSAKGQKVVLVGASAGASAVINAYIERKDKVSAVIYICAKINGPETVSEKTYAKNPAFKESVYLLQDNLKKLIKEDKQKLHSFYSPGDHYVPYAATTISGVAESRLPPLRHGMAIIYAISFGFPRIIRTIKQIIYN